jgi:hypothetical protein
MLETRAFRNCTRLSGIRCACLKTSTPQYSLYTDADACYDLYEPICSLFVPNSVHHSGTFGVVVHFGDTMLARRVGKCDLYQIRQPGHRSLSQIPLTLATIDAPRKGASSLVAPLKLVK